MARITLRAWRLAREVDESRRVRGHSMLLADLQVIADRNRTIASAVAARIMETGERKGELACPACGGTITYAPREYAAGTYTDRWTETRCSTLGCVGNSAPLGHDHREADRCR